MKADGARRFDLELIGESCFVDDMLKGAMCGWRTADVAHAEEEDGGHFGGKVLRCEGGKVVAI